MFLLICLLIYLLFRWTRFIIKFNNSIRLSFINSSCIVIGSSFFFSSIIISCTTFTSIVVCTSSFTGVIICCSTCTISCFWFSKCLLHICIWLFFLLTCIILNLFFIINFINMVFCDWLVNHLFNFLCVRNLLFLFIVYLGRIFFWYNLIMFENILIRLYFSCILWYQVTNMLTWFKH